MTTKAEKSKKCLRFRKTPLYNGTVPGFQKGAVRIPLSLRAVETISFLSIVNLVFRADTA